MKNTAGLRAFALGIGLATAFAGAVALQVPASAATSQSAETAASAEVASCHGKRCKRVKRHCRHCKPGPRGPKGDKGDPGISGYEVVSEEFTAPPSSFTGHVVPCPRGKVVLGGGVQTLSFGFGSRILDSGPSASPVGWGAGFATAANPSSYRIFAICAFKK